MKKNYKIKEILAPFFVTIMFFYFVYHIFQGDRGVRAWVKLNKELKQNEIILEGLEAEKIIIEKQVYLMRPDSLDVDILEEKAKQVLNFAKPNEVLIKKDSFEKVE